MIMSNIPKYLLGDQLESSIEQRVFNYFCATSFFLSFASGVFNSWFAPNPGSFILPTLMAAVMAGCWYLSRFTGRLETAAMIALVSLIGFFTPGFWITNGGSTGGYQYFLVVIAAVIAALSPKSWRMKGISAICLVTMALIVLEYYHPELIMGYPDRLARFADLVFSMSLSIVLAAGIFLVYTKGYESEQQRAKEYAARLEELATVDHLTGLHNRAFALQQLESQIYEAGRYELDLSVIMIDFDWFKQINDNHGHKAGDTVLAKVAEIFRSEVRASDIACRYGGEEFLVICPNSSLEETHCLAERLRTLVENQGAIDPDLHRLTLSCGIAQWQGGDADLLIDRADRAMYAAKKSGRNCVRIFDSQFREAI